MKPTDSKNTADIRAMIDFIIKRAAAGDAKAKRLLARIETVKKCKDD